MWCTGMPIVAAIRVLANIFCSWAIGPIRKQVLHINRSSIILVKFATFSSDDELQREDVKF